ncbi:MAG: hypothetical protein AAF517_07235, partial [Planctomycetota bacterium]
MMQRHRTAIAFALIVLIALVTRGAKSLADGESTPFFVREVYVPYEEFLRRTKLDPGGVVMDLEEYRKLALEGLKRSRKAPETQKLSPAKAVVTQGRHSAKIEGEIVKVRSTLTIRSYQKEGEWAICDLGPAPLQPGKTSLGDAPAWIVQSTSPSKKKGSAPSRPRWKLLIEKPGVHLFVVEHSLSATRSKDNWSLTVDVPPAATGSFTLEVPGAIELLSNKVFASARVDGERSTVDVALGTRGRSQISWRAQRRLGSNDSLLVVEQRISVVARDINPTVFATLSLTTFRRAVEQLDVDLPENWTILRVQGNRIRAWRTEGRRLSLSLLGETLGTIQVNVEALLTTSDNNAAARTYALAPAVVPGSRSNTGFFALCQSDESRLEVTTQGSTRELAASDAAVSVPTGTQVAQLYSYAAPDARLEFRSIQRPNSFEVESLARVEALERSLISTSRHELRVGRGRIYRTSFAVPANWRVVSLSVSDPSGRLQVSEQRYSSTAQGQPITRIDLSFQRALTKGLVLGLDLQLEATDFPSDGDWSELLRELRVPRSIGADVERSSVAIALGTSLLATEIQEGSWTPLKRHEIDVLPVNKNGLVAGLRTESPVDPISVRLSHRTSQGEFELVTHVLTFERRVRVRHDLSVTIAHRSIDTLRVQLPIDSETPTPVLGDGVREVQAVARANGGSFRDLLFENPWVGTRRLRLEYETDLSPETEITIPNLTIVSSLESSRIVVFQSAGPVEVTVTGGDGSVPLDLDAVPDFARPWPIGRRLRALRVLSRGNAGTYRTEIHDRVDIVGSFARRLDLVTTLGPRGNSRTQAEFLLAYVDRQTLEISLAPESKILSVEIDGEPSDGIRPAGTNRWSIPLPPKSYARLSLIYERRSPALASNWGTWREPGPKIDGIPVGETHWTFRHPNGIRCFLGEGNLRPIVPSLERRPRTVFSSLLLPFLSGSFPSISTFVYDNHVRNYEAANSEETKFVAEPRGGIALHATKMGGDAVLAIDYRSFDWWNFAKKLSFVATLLLVLFSLQREGVRPTLKISLAALAYLAAFSSAAAGLVGWESPFLMIPAGEALFFAILFCCVAAAVQAVGRRLQKRKAALASILFLSLLASGSASADEPAERPADDTVLIPYRADKLPVEDLGKVFLSREQFERLWSLAHPTEAPPRPPVTREPLPGNFAYDLRVRG